MQDGGEADIICDNCKKTLNPILWSAAIGRFPQIIQASASHRCQRRLHLRFDNLEEVIEVQNMEKMSGVLVDAK